VKTTRWTPEGPRVPRSMERKHAFPPETLPDPTGPSCRQVYAEVTTARGEGSPCQRQTGNLGRVLAPRQIPYQEELRNSPLAGKDPSRKREYTDPWGTI
jgi:hypothetical protein